MGEIRYSRSMPNSTDQFRVAWKSVSESPALLNGVNKKFCSFFYSLRRLEKKSAQGKPTALPVTGSFVNIGAASAIFKSVNKFLSGFCHSHTSVEIMWEIWPFYFWALVRFVKFGAEKYGRKLNYIYTCTLKPYDILRKKKRQSLRTTPRRTPSAILQFIKNTWLLDLKVSSHSCLNADVSVASEISQFCVKRVRYYLRACCFCALSHAPARVCMYDASKALCCCTLIWAHTSRLSTSSKKNQWIKTLWNLYTEFLRTPSGDNR
jgi:hypothetical protein